MNEGVRAEMGPVQTSSDHLPLRKAYDSLISLRLSKKEIKGNRIWKFRDLFYLCAPIPPVQAPCSCAMKEIGSPGNHLQSTSLTHEVHASLSSVLSLSCVCLGRHKRELHARGL